MTPSLRFVCQLPTGLHARPASVLAETVRRYHSAARIVNEQSHAEAEARSVLSVIALDIQCGHPVLIEALGDDAPDLIESVRALVASNFGEAPGTHAEPSATRDAAFIPRIPPPIRHAGARVLTGRPVCEGLGVGRIVIAGAMQIPDAVASARAESPDAERRRIDEAFAALRRDLEHDLRGASGPAAEIVRAHLAMADDPTFRARVESLVAQGSAATAAICQSARHVSAQLAASTSAYIRERVQDVDEIARRLLAHIDPAALQEAPIVLTEPAIVAADSLGVGQLMALDRTHLKGLVLGPVGRTSHLVILARSLQIPTLIGVEAPHATLTPGATAVVDAVGGFVVADASGSVLEYFQRDERIRRARRTRLEPILRRAGATRDGRTLEVAANAASAPEIAAAIAAGADGVGLLRTELLFLDRGTPPNEEEQYALYRAAIEAAAADGEPRPVIIRTLDIGGDKPAPYLTFPKEDNPFLGVRGIRLSQHHPDLFGAQLRAICRASAHGPVKVMAPMVATVAEARWFCDRIARAQAELADAGIAFDPTMPVGVMVEVPSVATIIPDLAKVLDFLSIGTNDLSQYWTAADRTNPVVAPLNNVLEPSFLRLLNQIISAANASDIWIGMCGEMAGDPAHLPLLVGLGLSEISVAAPALARIKPLLASLDAPACTELTRHALACESAEQVVALLAEFARQHGAQAAAQPLDPELILFDCDASTKEAAIHELVGALHIAGRTDDPRAVEEAIWAREAEYSTGGLGFAVAIPHAKTDAVRCQSIAVACLRTPIDWGAPDAPPIRTVIMLTARASDASNAHLTLFAKLARKLMHESFRDALAAAPNVDAVMHTLRTELGLAP